MMLTRRDALKTLAAGLFVGTTQAFGQTTGDGVPVRRITSGPKFHWFGYYDKHQFDPTGRFVLSNEVDFEGRSPTPDDVIKVGLIDLEDNDRWTELGRCNAWGWQQGCMLQWIPGSNSKVIWNDRLGDRFVAHVVDVETGDKRTIPYPVYALSADGKFGVSTDFERIQNMRPGYGYAGVTDRNESVKAPDDSGIRRVDLETGEAELIVTYAEMAAIKHDGTQLAEKWHYFNHLLVSPDSRRTIFLHRWRDQPARARGKSFGGGFTTRMFTVNVDGSDPYMIDPSGHTSHFIWRDAEHICAWSKYQGKNAFFLYRDRTAEVSPVGHEKMPVNGHNTYLNRDGADWILNDTYPRGKERLQTPYLYHVPTDTRHDLGHFHQPPEYKGEVRCDLHPRSNHQGTFVTIDSTHEGGRQQYLLDLRPIVEA